MISPTWRQWLTPEEKKDILDGWEDRQTTLMRPATASGGRGFVDAEIVPLCNALNQLPGVCTLQSCAGHAANDSDGAEYSGELWLRLDYAMSCRFEKAVHQLASNPLIERVGKIYWGDGKETITIKFQGNEAGWNKLRESGAAILAFFSKIHY